VNIWRSCGQKCGLCNALSSTCSSVVARRTKCRWQNLLACNFAKYSKTTKNSCYWISKDIFSATQSQISRFVVHIRGNPARFSSILKELPWYLFPSLRDSHNASFHGHGKPADSAGFPSSPCKDNIFVPIPCRSPVKMCSKLHRKQKYRRTL